MVNVGGSFFHRLMLAANLLFLEVVIVCEYLALKNFFVP